MAGTSKKEAASINKAKKTKNEVIRSTVAFYLKQKNYIALEKFRKSDFVLSQTKKQFIFNKMIEEDVSKSNSFLYSNVLCLTNHHGTVDQQFGKFVNFVQNQPESIKFQLSNLFGPFICHLYIELLKGKEFKPAVDFLRKNCHLVAPVENYDAPLTNKVNGSSAAGAAQDDSSLPTATTQILFRKESTGNPIHDHFKDIMQTLSTCLAIEELENLESIILLRSAKYEIEIDFAAVDALQKFLDKHGHVVILSILHTWIHLNIIDFKDKEEESSIFVLDEGSDKPSVSKNGKDRIESTVTEGSKDAKPKIPPERIIRRGMSINLRKLKYAAYKFQKFDLPARTIRIADPQKCLSTCNIDSQSCHLVAGFDNSIVKLWQLNQNTCRGRNMYAQIQDRCCDWELNNTNDDSFSEDDDDDDDEKLDTQTFKKIPSKKTQKETYLNDKFPGNSFDDSGGIRLHGHTRGVTDALFSSHHPLLLTVSKDQTMRMWKASNYSCASVYRGHNHPIWCVAESPINMYIATGSKDLTARLWSLDRQFPLITYVGHTQDVDCIAFHPNGNYLATGSCDLSVRLWSITDGKLFRVFSDCKLPVTTVAFSPNGKLIAAAGEETKVRIFDLAAGSQLSELKDHTAPVTSIAWNSTGSKFATCCTDGSVRMWDVSKIGKQPQQSSSNSSANKILWHMFGCSRAMKIFFNSNDSISCIGK